MGATGLGSDIVFGTSAFTANLISITPGAITRDDIECTKLLSTVQKEWAPGDLIDSDVFTVVYHYDAENIPPYNAAAELITMNFPLLTGDSVKPKLAGTGYINSFTPGGVLNADGRMEGTFSVKFDGIGTPLAFTDGAA
jgi:hypothetical protein